MPKVTFGEFAADEISNIVARLETLRINLEGLAGAMRENDVPSLTIDYKDAMWLGLDKIHAFTQSGFDRLEKFKRARGDYGREAAEPSEELPASAGKSPRNGRTKVKGSERSSKPKGR
jgi:hypothetical protein